MIKTARPKFQWKKLSPKQYWSIIESLSKKYQYNIWVGATRAGKTISSIIAWRVFVRKNKNKGAFLMVGRTLGTLKRNVIDEMERIFGSENCFITGSNGYEVLNLYGQEIFLAGADNKVAVEKIRGLPSVIGVYVDEVAAIPEECFIMIRSRMALEGSTMFATCNPESKFHWLKKNWIDKRKEKKLRMKVFSFRLIDNTSLAQSVIEEISNAFKGTVYYLRYILAQWAVAEGAIYSCFNPNIHGITKHNLPEKFDRHAIGIDYGAQNPCAFVHLGFKNNTKYGIKEFYHNGREKGTKLNSEYAQEFEKFFSELYYKYKPEDSVPVYIDPSAAALIEEFERNTILDKFRDFFHIVTPCNDVDPGIQRVAIEINNHQLFVVKEDCPNLIEEFGAYVWDPKKDVPVSAFNHALDALRYAIYTEFLQNNGEIENTSRSIPLDIDLSIYGSSNHINDDLIDENYNPYDMFA